MGYDARVLILRDGPSGLLRMRKQNGLTLRSRPKGGVSKGEAAMSERLT